MRRTIVSLGLLVLAWVLPSKQLVASPLGEEFSCRLVLSIDGSVDDRWEHVSSKGVKIPEVSHVVKQQTFCVCVFFTNCKSDPKGKVDVEYDVRITKPGGGTYFEQKDLSGWKGPIGGDSKDVLYARNLLRVSFDPPDPMGEYVVTVTAHDLIGKSSASDTRKMMVKEYDEGASFENKEALLAWFGTYRSGPDPERVIPAFLAFEKEGGFDHPDVFPIAMGYFSAIFESNPWLHSILLAETGDSAASVRRDVLRLLARIVEDHDAFGDKLSEADRSIWTELTREPRHDPLHDPIAGRDDVNALFGAFYASGMFAIAQRLCDSLAPDETGAVAKTTIHEKTTGMDVPLGMVVASVVSKSIARSEDPLFRSYCESIRASPKTSAAIRRELDKALQGK